MPPGAFGHPKISIPAGERAQMTPPGIEPADFPRWGYETSTLPLSHGRVAEWAGRARTRRAGRLFLQALWRRSQPSFRLQNRCASCSRIISIQIASGEIVGKSVASGCEVFLTMPGGLGTRWALTAEVNMSAEGPAQSIQVGTGFQ